jgi:hypothetical protein
MPNQKINLENFLEPVKMWGFQEGVTTPHGDVSCEEGPQNQTQIQGITRWTPSAQNTVPEAMVYLKERSQSLSKDVWVKFGGKLAKVFKSPLPVEPHRTHFIF